MTCTPDALADAAKCYMGIPYRVRKAMRIVNLCRLVNGDAPLTDIQEQVTAAKCYTSSLSDDQLDSIETFLICSLAP